MLTDIEIAQQATLQPITKIAADLGITEDELIPYGRYKAKLDNAVFRRLENEKDGKLILVTAIKPPQQPVWVRHLQKSARRQLLRCVSHLWVLYLA